MEKHGHKTCDHVWSDYIRFIFHHISSYFIIFHHISSYFIIFHHISSYFIIFHHISILIQYFFCSQHFSTEAIKNHRCWKNETTAASGFRARRSEMTGIQAPLELWSSPATSSPAHLHLTWMDTILYQLDPVGRAKYGKIPLLSHFS